MIKAFLGVTPWLLGSTLLLHPHSARAQFSGALTMTAVVTPPVGSVGIAAMNANELARTARYQQVDLPRAGTTAVQVRVSGGCTVVASVNPVWRQRAGAVAVRVRDRIGRAYDLRDDRAVVVDACGNGRLDAALAVELGGPMPPDLLHVPPVLVRIELDAGP